MHRLSLDTDVYHNRANNVLNKCAFFKTLCFKSFYFKKSKRQMVSCINGILLRLIGFSSPVFKSRKLLLLHFLQPEKNRNVWAVGETIDRMFKKLHMECLRSAHGFVHSCYNALEFVVARSLNAFFICFSQSSSVLNIISYMHIVWHKVFLKYTFWSLAR